MYLLLIALAEMCHNQTTDRDVKLISVGTHSSSQQYNAKMNTKEHTGIPIAAIKKPIWCVD
jgi:hypothetical protein